MSGLRSGAQKAQEEGRLNPRGLSFILIVVAIFAVLPFVRPCVPMVQREATTVAMPTGATTAPPPMTTQAPGGMTTTSGPLCSRCMANQLMQIQVNEGAKAIEGDVPSTNNNGCAVRMLTCMGTGAGSTAFLSWNNDQSGTTQGAPGANVVMETLTCNAQGTAWSITRDVGGQPVTTDVNVVECTAT